jgi:hypothetical protein
MPTYNCEVKVSGSHVPVLVRDADLVERGPERVEPLVVVVQHVDLHASGGDRWAGRLNPGCYSVRVKIAATR